MQSSGSTICKMEDISPLNNTPYRRILLVKPSSLGDVLHAFPAFYLLRKSLPHAKIDWVINSNLASILSYIRPDLNRIINFRRNDFKNVKNAPFALLNIVTGLRRHKYDLAIDMQGLLRSSMMTFVSKSGEKIGFSDLKEKISGVLYDKKIETPEHTAHAIEKNCYLISKILGIEYRVPDFFLPPAILTDITTILKKVDIEEYEKYICFSPVARWITKSWPPEFFASIADSVVKEFPGKKIILLGSKSERAAVDKIVSICKFARPINLAGKTSICELVELLRKSELLLTNDSGPMHIAAAVRTPVFAMFGPTDPEKTGPYWQWNTIYQAGGGCIKCFSRVCKKSLDCQRAISAKTVSKDIINKLYSNALSFR